MTSNRWLSLAAALTAMLALAGCTQTSAGSPLPEDTGIASDPDPPGSSSSEPSSERPREIKLDGRDPCGLIPQTDWPKFDIERPGDPSEEPNFKSPTCYYSSVGDVTLVVTEGIAAWDDRSQNADISDAESIEGFPTITVWNKADKRSCYTAIDVADGQYLLTTVMSIDANVDRTATCDLAYQLAESAMKTLVAS